MSTITGSQLRAARALVRWRAEDLAAQAKIGVATVRRSEASDGPVGMTAANAAAIRSAFERVGVIFIDDDGEGPGVRIRKSLDAAE